MTVAPLRIKQCSTSTRRFAEGAMAYVLPRELVQGAGRGQKLRGRVCGLDTNSKGSQDAVSFYLVTGEKLDDMVYIEAWRDHARTTKGIVKEHVVIEIANLTIKALGEKVQWQATSLDVFGQILAPTKITLCEEDAKLPPCPGMVLLEKLPHYRKVPHLINVAGIVVDVQVQTRG